MPAAHHRLRKAQHAACPSQQHAPGLRMPVAAATPLVVLARRAGVHTPRRSSDHAKKIKGATATKPPSLAWPRNAEARPPLAARQQAPPPNLLPGAARTLPPTGRAAAPALPAASRRACAVSSWRRFPGRQTPRHALGPAGGRERARSLPAHSSPPPPVMNSLARWNTDLYGDERSMRKSFIPAFERIRITRTSGKSDTQRL